MTDPTSPNRGAVVSPRHNNNKMTTLMATFIIPKAWPNGVLLVVLVATSNYASLYLGMRLSSQCHRSSSSSSSSSRLSSNPSLTATASVAEINNNKNNNIVSSHLAASAPSPDNTDEHHLATNHLRQPYYQHQTLEKQQQTSSSSWANTPIFSPNNNNNKVVLVTGGAGFIGSHVATALLQRGDTVIILDNMNDYYNVSIKELNLIWVRQAAAAAAAAAGKETKNNTMHHGENYYYPNLFIHRGDINNATLLTTIFEQHSSSHHPPNNNNNNTPIITHICHLAARAGVRPSIQNPHLYVETNILGTLNILEFARRYNVTNVVMASSSSVYGEVVAVDSNASDDNNNEKEKTSTTSFSEDIHSANQPLSPYAQTKRSQELLSYTYHALYRMNVTNLRFFTVYGPRGRPDMAPHTFVSNIARDIRIEQYGDGTSSRDYTYIDDAVDGVLRSLDRAYPYQIINIGGGSNGMTLSDFISLVEEQVGKKAKIVKRPNQLGDVSHTRANITKANMLLGYVPSVTMEEGVRRTVQWYKETYPDIKKDG